MIFVRDDFGEYQGLESLAGEKEGAYLVEKKTITMCINPDNDLSYLRGLSALQGKKVGMVNGSRESGIRNAYPGIQVVDVENHTKAMQMVSGGELDAAITPLVAAAYIIAKERLFDIKISGETGLKSRYTIGVKKMMLYCRELWKKRCYPCQTMRVKRSAINGSRFAWKKERTTV